MPASSVWVSPAASRSERTRAPNPEAGADCVVIEEAASVMSSWCAFSHLLRRDSVRRSNLYVVNRGYADHALPHTGDPWRSVRVNTCEPESNRNHLTELLNFPDTSPRVVSTTQRPGRQGRRAGRTSRIRRRREERDWAAESRPSSRRPERIRPIKETPPGAAAGGVFRRGGETELPPTCPPSLALGSGNARWPPAGSSPASATLRVV